MIYALRHVPAINKPSESRRISFLENLSSPPLPHETHTDSHTDSHAHTDEDAAGMGDSSEASQPTLSQPTLQKQDLPQQGLASSEKISHVTHDIVLSKEDISVTVSNPEKIGLD